MGFVPALVLLMATACNVISSQSLMESLPTAAGGVVFDNGRVIQGDPISPGHPIDDVLLFLEKQRSDATTVEQFSSAGDGSIGAVRINGVPGAQVLDAAVATWRAASVVRRTQVPVGDRSVWVLEHRGGQFTLFYVRADNVYWASADDRALAEQFVAAMP